MDVELKDSKELKFKEKKNKREKILGKKRKLERVKNSKYGSNTVNRIKIYEISEGRKMENMRNYYICISTI